MFKPTILVVISALLLFAGHACGQPADVTSVTAYPERFSPNDDDVQDTTLINVSAAEGQILYINVHNLTDHIVRTGLPLLWNSQEQVYQTIWNGTDDFWQVVSDGQYALYVTDDPTGDRSSEELSVIGTAWVDIRSPEMYFLTPLNMSEIRGEVTLQAVDITIPPDYNVSYEREIERISFDHSQNGVNWTTIGTDRDGSDGWSVLWNTSEVPDGTRLLRLRARDLAGNVGTEIIEVEVNNTQTFNLSDPECEPTFGFQGDMFFFNVTLHDSYGMPRMFAGINRMSSGPNDMHPRIVVDDEGDAHIVWMSNRTGHWEIWYKEVASDGSVIVNDTMISDNDTYDSMYPAIAVEPFRDVDAYLDMGANQYALMMAPIRLYRDQYQYNYNRSIPVNVNTCWQQFIPTKNRLNYTDAPVMIEWIDVLIYRPADNFTSPLNLSLESPLGNQLTSKSVLPQDIPVGISWVAFDLNITEAQFAGQRFYIRLTSSDPYEWCYITRNDYESGNSSLDNETRSWDFAFVDRCGDPETFYKVDMTNTRSYLLSLGYDDSRIYFYTIPWKIKNVNWSIPGVQQTFIEPWIDGNATYGNMQNALNQLKGSVGSEDLFFLYLHDHGGRVRRDGSPPDPRKGDETADTFDEAFCTYSSPYEFWNPKNYWYDDELDMALDQFRAKYMILFVEACYSGGFIPDISGRWRIVLTTSRENQRSWRYAYRFGERLTDPNADLDGNGKVSMEEIHAYTSGRIKVEGKTNAPQNPLMDDQISEQDVHVVWYDKRSGHWEVYYSKVKDDKGIDLTVPDWNVSANDSYDSGRVVQNPIDDETAAFIEHPDILVDIAFNVSVVWSDVRDGSWEVYYQLQTNAARPSVIVDDRRISALQHDSTFPAIAGSPPIMPGNYTDYDVTKPFHIVWQDARTYPNGTWEIFYEKINPYHPQLGAFTLIDDLRLTAADGYDSAAPDVMCDRSGYVHLVFMDRRADDPGPGDHHIDGQWEVYSMCVNSSNGAVIYEKRQSDMVNSTWWGQYSGSWLGDGDSMYPRLAVHGNFSYGNMFIVWHDHRDGNWEIYLTKVPNSCNNPSTDQRATKWGKKDMYPDVGLETRGSAQIVWQSEGSWVIKRVRISDNYIVVVFPPLPGIPPMDLYPTVPVNTSTRQAIYRVGFPIFESGSSQYVIYGESRSWFASTDLLEGPSIYEDMDEPEIQISYPEDNSWLSEVVQIDLMTSSDTRFIALFISQDNRSWYPLGSDTDPSDGWSYLWNTTEVSDGHYLLRAMSVDRAFHESNVTINVSVDNTAPDITFTMPLSGDLATGNQTLWVVDCTEMPGNEFTNISRVEFYFSVDGENWTYIDEDSNATDGFHVLWKTSDINGTVQVGAFAYDESQNLDVDVIYVHVDQDPPYPTFQTPTRNSTLDGIVPVELTTASSDLTSISVEVLLKPYSYVKNVPRADQHWRTEWGDAWCGPTAAGSCLAYWAENGYPDLIIDSNGNPNEVTRDELEVAIDELGKYMRTSPTAGTSDVDFVNGLMRYISAHGGGLRVDYWDMDDADLDPRHNEPSFEDYRRELEANAEDVLVGIMSPRGGHWLVGNSVSNTANPNGTYYVDFMDPWTGDVIHTIMRPNGDIWYDRSWWDFDIMVTVSPLEETAAWDIIDLLTSPIDGTYETNWDTTEQGIGYAFLRAIAHDNLGYTVSETIVVLLENQLPAPENFSIEADDNNVTITWSPIEGADLYQVFTSSDPCGFNFTTPMNTTQTSWTHLGVNDPGGDNYSEEMYYLVRGLNLTYDVSGHLTPVLGKFTASFHGTQAGTWNTFSLPLEPLRTRTADWYCDVIPGCQGIAHYLSAEGVWETHATGMPQGSTDFSIVMGEGYMIIVNASVMYTFTGRPAAHVILNGRMSAPSNFSISVSEINESWIDVEWDAVFDADSYAVMRSSTRGGNFTTVCVINETGSSHYVWTDQNASSSDEYYYLVVPLDERGNPGNSSYALGKFTVSFEGSPAGRWNAFALPLMSPTTRSADWYCDAIQNTDAIAHFLVYHQVWESHATPMPSGATDWDLVTCEAYMLVLTDTTSQYTFIGS